MKAVRINSYGGTDLLQYEDAPLPLPGENDVLIHVQAASVNPVDVAFRAGYMNAMVPLAFPATLGCDVAGAVEAVGVGVSGFKVGDAVYSRTDLHRLGGYAEYVVVTATEVALKPPSLDFVEAASVPQAALTAWRALIDTAGLKSGQTVLILGAAGGVGSIAVQLAKSRGARVIGVASTGNQAFLKEIGADKAIDYTAGPFEEQVKDVDVVFDCVGGDTLERAFETLKPGGIIVSVVQPPSAEKAASLGVRTGFAMAMGPAAPVLDEITKLVEAGKIKPHVSKVLFLQEACDAQELIAGHHTRGKIVLKV